jgi:hypothetical protein
MASGGGGWSGKIKYKTIMIVNLIDADAYPSDGDYYKNRVYETGSEDMFRIWLTENADHHLTHDAFIPYLNNRLINFRGVIEQALLDLCAWVENGIEPPISTSYTVVDSQLNITDNTEERGGLQPAIELTVNGLACTTVAPGEPVSMSANIRVPKGTGGIIKTEWDFIGNGGFIDAVFVKKPDGSWTVCANHIYNDEGIFFPQVRITSQRESNTDTLYTKIYNLGRARVIVKGD